MADQGERPGLDKRRALLWVRPRRQSPSQAEDSGEKQEAPARHEEDADPRADFREGEGPARVAENRPRAEKYQPSG